ncbi:MAG: hypothetical protein SGI98_01705 [Verrucomicrobiota bacterium]|nr:hypothetical protein [Verrucomicrobiota bacterium]
MQGRSLNEEVLSILETAVNPVRKNPRDILRQIRERRDRMPHIVHEIELPEIISGGRA